MVPCSISWCVALTDTQFCPIHEKDQALHPAEIDDEEDDIDIDVDTDEDNDDDD